MNKNQLTVVNPGANNLGEAFGLTILQYANVLNKTESIVRGQKDETPPPETIARVWNSFDTNEESALAMYMLRHTENKVEIDDAFRYVSEEAGN